MEQDKIWTIGHSTRGIDEFLEILKSAQIQMVADVRRFPFSKKYIQYNKENFEIALKGNNIMYTHIPELGGRRTGKKNSANTAWRNKAFRAYADHMETSEYLQGIERLIEVAKKYRTAYMCSEAVWWRCHRSLISDYLKSKGWHVIHLMGLNKSQEHPFTSAARMVEGKLIYH